jgi:MFS family permease
MFSRLLFLYAALYAGFGVLSPYLPSLLNSRDVRPEEIALVLATGGAVRLAAGPATGRLADRFGAPKVVLSLCSSAAALSVLAYPSAQGLWLLLAVGPRRCGTRRINGAAATADAMCCSSHGGRRRSRAWRAAEAAALPPGHLDRRIDSRQPCAARQLCLMWGSAGIGPGTAGLLWSLSVAAEVIVFLFIGHPLLDPFTFNMHAAFDGMRSPTPSGDGVNILRCHRRWCPGNIANASVWTALWLVRSTGVLGDGGSLRRGVAFCSDATRAIWQTNLIFRRPTTQFRSRFSAGHVCFSGILAVTIFRPERPTGRADIMQRVPAREDRSASASDRRAA